jgi:hypothetical protein
MNHGRCGYKVKNYHQMLKEECTISFMTRNHQKHGMRGNYRTPQILMYQLDAKPQTNVGRETQAWHDRHMEMHVAMGYRST